MCDRDVRDLAQLQKTRSHDMYVYVCVCVCICVCVCVGGCIYIMYTYTTKAACIHTYICTYSSGTRHADAHLWSA